MGGRRAPEPGTQPWLDDAASATKWLDGGVRSQDELGVLRACYGAAKTMREAVELRRAMDAAAPRVAKLRRTLEREGHGRAIGVLFVEHPTFGPNSGSFLIGALPENVKAWLAAQTSRASVIPTFKTTAEFETWVQKRAPEFPSLDAFYEWYAEHSRQPAINWEAAPPEVKAWLSEQQKRHPDLHRDSTFHFDPWWWAKKIAGDLPVRHRPTYLEGDESAEHEVSAARQLNDVLVFEYLELNTRMQDDEQIVKLLVLCACKVLGIKVPSTDELVALALESNVDRAQSDVADSEEGESSPRLRQLYRWRKIPNQVRQSVEHLTGPTLLKVFPFEPA